MKKFLILTLAVIFILSLVACSKDTPAKTDGGITDTAVIYDDKWPENEFTTLLPKPSMTIWLSSSDAKVFTAQFSGTTIDKLREYASNVKAAGFDVNEYTVDDGGNYSFQAENATGYQVQVYSVNGMMGLALEKLN